MINTAPQGSNSVNSRENTSRLSIFHFKLCSGHMAQWYEVSFFALEEVGVQVHIPGDYFLCLFLFFSSYFYPLACFRLFSMLLASRDFCDNVFLNILVTILLVTPIQLSRFKSKVTKGPWVHAVSRDSFSHTGNNFTDRLVLHIFREFLLVQSTPDNSNPR